MIYILAGTYSDAKKWAQAHQLSELEWFCTLDIEELKRYSNFHVVVIESASELHPGFFEKIFREARIRGRIDRQ